MSVIFGHKTNQSVLISGDRRGTTIHGNTNDSVNKITIINNNLALVSAGNAAYGTGIEIELRGTKNLDDINLLDMLRIINGCYSNIKHALLNMGVPDVFCCLIASSLNNDLKLTVCNAHSGSKELEVMETTNFIFPPPDIELQKCNGIYARNYHLFNYEFAERTVKDIAKLSDFVSITGDKWTYDIASGA